VILVVKEMKMNIRNKHTCELWMDFYAICRGIFFRSLLVSSQGRLVLLAIIYVILV